MIKLPFDDVGKQKILQEIMLRFEEGKEYGEMDVNEIIRSFDVDDHALIRRELINFGYLARDNLKNVYWVKKHKLSDEELAKIKSRQEGMKKAGVYDD